MFDKLKSLLASEPEKEFKPRVQGKRPAKLKPSLPEEAPEAKFDSPASEQKFGGKGILIGEDPFKGKLDDQQQERIQSKLEMLKQLKEELGIDE